MGFGYKSPLPHNGIATASPFVQARPNIQQTNNNPKTLKNENSSCSQFLPRFSSISIFIESVDKAEQLRR
ncbi:MAG TPA: hypothetical protein VMA13_01115, partial [Candidatus Saccharimonadales bacterium]|nr:hypothetical protein [Candidatus Saccharimonadales bacterium]